MLSEDYQHKKICGFMLNGVCYNVATWQDALVTLCNILSESNSDKFLQFCDMSDFKGTKVSYFSKNYENTVESHFVDVNKSSPMPNGGERIIDDIQLSRYACYLIVQNGNPRKEVIALGQTYVAVKTRQQELIENYNVTNFQH